MASSQLELVLFPCLCAGALVVVVVYAVMKYRRSASGVSPHDVSSAARHAGSWSSRLRDSFSRNSGGSQETSAKDSEGEDGKSGERDASGQARELEEIVTPSYTTGSFNNSANESLSSPVIDSTVLPVTAGRAQGSTNVSSLHHAISTTAAERARVENEAGEKEEEDGPIQFSPPVSGNVSTLFFDAVTVSLSDISQKSVSPNRSPASVKTWSRQSSPLTGSPLRSPFPLLSPLEEPHADLEAGLARSKAGWRTKLGHLLRRAKSTTSTSTRSSGRSHHHRNASSSAGGDDDHDSSGAVSVATTSTSPERPETSRVYTAKELSRATSGFDKRNEIGVGGFGKVYKGFLGNQYMAIKKISANSQQGVKEFVSEVSITGRMRALRHPNLVPLLGWCQDKGELLLVYSYFPAGSLDRILHSRINPGSNPLSWDQRYKIISDVASALAFLHSGWAHCVIHRDVKTSNILLDGDKAVLGDFGLARQHNFGQLPLTTAPAGTPGYVPPEVTLATDEKHMTDKLDIYSFGVVALEIACGRRPIDYKRDRPYLLDWVWGLHEQNRLLEAADPRLAGHFDSDQMLLVLRLGLLCSHLDPRIRCRMTDVVKYLLREMVPPPVPALRPYVIYS